MDRVIYTIGFIGSVMMVAACLAALFIPHNHAGDWFISMWGAIAAIMALVCLHNITKSK